MYPPIRAEHRRRAAGRAPHNDSGMSERRRHGCQRLLEPSTRRSTTRAVRCTRRVPRWIPPVRRGAMKIFVELGERADRVADDFYRLEQHPAIADVCLPLAWSTDENSCPRSARDCATTQPRRPRSSSRRYSPHTGTAAAPAVPELVQLLAPPHPGPACTVLAGLGPAATPALPLLTRSGLRALPDHRRSRTVPGCLRRSPRPPAAQPTAARQPSGNALHRHTRNLATRSVACLSDRVVMRSPGGSHAARRLEEAGLWSSQYAMSPSNGDPGPPHVCNGERCDDARRTLRRRDSRYGLDRPAGPASPGQSDPHRAAGQRRLARAAPPGGDRAQRGRGGARRTETVMLFRSHLRCGISVLGLATSADGVTDWRCTRGRCCRRRPRRDRCAAASTGSTSSRSSPAASRTPGSTPSRTRSPSPTAPTTPGSATGYACRSPLTDDFTTFTRYGPVLDRDMRNVVLFPERIGGRYVGLFRPNDELPGRHRRRVHADPDRLHGGLPDRAVGDRRRAGDAHGRRARAPSPTRSGRARRRCGPDTAGSTCSTAYAPRWTATRMCSASRCTTWTTRAWCACQASRCCSRRAADCRVADTDYVHVPNVVFSCGLVRRTDRHAGHLLRRQRHGHERGRHPRGRAGGAVPAVRPGPADR